MYVRDSLLDNTWLHSQQLILTRYDWKTREWVNIYQSHTAPMTQASKLPQQTNKSRES